MGVICCLEDLVCASVRSPSRSSGHLSVAVQWLYSVVLHSTVCGIFAGVSVLSVSPLWQCSVLDRGHKREIIGRINVNGNIYFWLGGHGWQMRSVACKKESSPDFCVLALSLSSLCPGPARPLTTSQTKIIERTGEGKLKVVEKDFERKTFLWISYESVTRRRISWELAKTSFACFLTGFYPLPLGSVTGRREIWSVTLCGSYLKTQSLPEACWEAWGIILSKILL